MNKFLIYNQVPCLILKYVEPDSFLVFHKNEQKWIFECSEGYGEITNNKHYFFNRKYHREKGPAVEYFNGTKHWYKNGNIHREDGPAYERINGYKEYWLNGTEYSEKEYFQKMKSYNENQ